jgi:NADPH oxidase
MKPRMSSKPGQYVFICCPEISLYEWHPFTLTSAPNEHFHSIHVRIVGDWTTAFSNRLGYVSDPNIPTVVPKSLPYIMIDGPYGAPAEDALKYETGTNILHYLIT